MDVRCVPKEQVSELLRSRRRALESNLSNPANRAAHDSLSINADVIDQAPGATIEESHRLLEADTARLVGRQRLYLATGGVLFAATAVAMFANSGPAPTLEVVGKLGGMVGAVGFIVAGGMTGDKISHNQRVDSVLHYWEDKLESPSTPPPAQSENLVLSQLTSAAKENRKDELVNVLTATNDYLAGRAEEPGLAAARQQVNHDLHLIQKAPGETLAEMRELAQADTVRAKRQSKIYLAAGVASFALGVASHLTFGPSLGMAAGGLLGMGLLFKGGTLTDNEGRNNFLIGTVHRWELQLDGLKEVANSEQVVRDLAAGGEKTSVGVQDGFLQVGGIRIPVRRAKPGG